VAGYGEAIAASYEYLLVTGADSAANAYYSLNGSDLLEVGSDYVVLQTPSVRLLYPTIEYQTNLANVQREGTINQVAGKVFRMP